jgi:hypothetical protein
MRDDIKKIIRILQLLGRENPHCFSEIMSQELYSISRESDRDAIGELKNTMQWLLNGVNKADNRQQETIQLSFDLPLDMLLEKIEDGYLLTEKIDSKRKTLGVFRDIDEVKNYLDNVA